MKNCLWHVIQRLGKCRSLKFEYPIYFLLVKKKSLTNFLTFVILDIQTLNFGTYQIAGYQEDVQTGALGPELHSNIDWAQMRHFIWANGRSVNSS